MFELFHEKRNSFESSTHYLLNYLLMISTYHYSSKCILKEIIYQSAVTNVLLVYNAFLEAAPQIKATMPFLLGSRARKNLLEQEIGL